MHFPLSGAEVLVPVWYLLLIGFTVGATSGFWGVGGGWMIVPALWMVGVPKEVAIGSSLAFLVANALMAGTAHYKLGNVARNLGLVLAASMVVGVEVGVRLIEYLKGIGQIDLAIRLAYLVMLGGIGFFVLFEALAAQRKLKAHTTAGGKVRDLAADGFARVLHQFRLPPHLHLAGQGEAQISVWIILGLGLVTGAVVGFLGVGGGFMALPALIYIVGTTTHVAIGTTLFAIIITASFGTYRHALQGNVDIILALMMLPTAAVGAQLGSLATRAAHGPKIRLTFALGLLATFASVLIDLAGLVTLGKVIIVAAACGLSLFVLYYFARSLSPLHRQEPSQD